MSERLRLLFQIFGATQARGRSPVYEALSEGITSDDGLLGLLMSTPGDQRRPSLLFAAVNLLLASSPDARLAAYYPIHGGRRPVDDGLMPAFASFCASRRDELSVLLRTRSTQTNEIRRCVALRLGLDHVRRHWPGPVALVEVGASAGLNLLLDHYGYRIGSGDLTPAGAGTTTPVTITCELRGGTVSFGPVPEITSRLGIDQHPVNLADPEARAWLEAFIWPEQTAEFATLRGAVDLSLSAAVAPVVPGVPVVTGDATADTARLIGELPGREPVVVFTASLLSYMGADARRSFGAQLRKAARDRPVAWVFAENASLVATAGPDLAALAGPAVAAGGNTLYLVGARLYGSADGTADRGDAVLALADPYLRWLAPARHESDDFRWLADVD